MTGTIIIDILQIRKGDTERLYNFPKIIQQKAVELGWKSRSDLFCTMIKPEVRESRDKLTQMLNPIT